MIGYVYITFNLINSKFYVGIHKRKTFTENYKGSGKIIKQALEKYGKENFSTMLVQRCETLEELNKAEIFWISEFKRIYGFENCYNISEGGNIPTNKGKPITEEQRLKLKQKSWKSKGLQNPALGIPRSEETKMLYSQLKQGKYNRQNNPNYGKKRKHIWKDGVHKCILLEDLNTYLQEGWVPGPSYNKSRKGITTKPMSEETKIKISNSTKGRIPHNKGKKKINNKFI